MVYAPGYQETPPAGYAVDSPMPLYEAIGMFTGQGLFPHFGATLAAASSSLSGVDVFASMSPDDIVLVNTNAAGGDGFREPRGDREAGRRAGTGCRTAAPATVGRHSG